MIKNIIELSITIGNKILEKKNSKNYKYWWKNNHLKCSLDLFANEYYFKELKKIKNIPIISEETRQSHNKVRPNIYWLIDPIDGTRSLVDGFKGWVTQVALVSKNKTLISVVYCPEYKQIFWAEKNQNAFLNEKKLIIKKKNIKDISLIDNYAKPEGIAKKIFKNFPCLKYLESGSISLKICRVAENYANLFVKNVSVRDWDIAAPKLILEEAGGCISLINGKNYNLTNNFKKNGIIASSNIYIQNRCLKLINEIDD